MEFGLRFALFLATFFPVWILTVTIPYLTRRTESFGISIPEEVFTSSDVQALRKGYAWTLGIAGVIFLLMYLLLAWLKVGSFSSILMLSLLLYLSLSSMLYLRNHKTMKRMKQEKNWFSGKQETRIVDTTFHQQPLVVSNVWYIIPFLMAFTNLIITLWNYHLFPDPLPMKYNLAGEVTSWADKSYPTVLLLPIMQFYITALFLFMSQWIQRSKQQIEVRKPKRSLKQNVLFRRIWSGFLVVTCITVNLIFFFMQLNYLIQLSPAWSLGFTLSLTGLLLIAAIILSFKTGQGGSRIPINDEETSDEIAIEKDDDAYWKLGQIHYNPHDPSAFVEKRFGIGWTVNFARPSVWVLLIFIVLISISLPLLLVGI